MTRGLTVVSTLEQLVGTLTAELKQKAVVLGWCIELLQAYFLIADDLMDQSVTRRGAPCWYRMPRVRRALSLSLSLSNSDRRGTMAADRGSVGGGQGRHDRRQDRKSTRLNSSH